MHDLISERTPPVIAAEINTIKHQTGKILLTGAIEIGRRLKEAKDLLPYGEWGKWLDESVSYSQSTAEKLMRIFEAYGTGQPASLDAGAQAQALPNLNDTQAFYPFRSPGGRAGAVYNIRMVKNIIITMIFHHHLDDIYGWLNFIKRILQNSPMVASVMTRESLEDVGFKEGDHAEALVKAINVVFVKHQVANTNNNIVNKTV